MGLCWRRAWALGKAELAEQARRGQLGWITTSNLCFAVQISAKGRESSSHVKCSGTRSSSWWTGGA